MDKVRVGVLGATSYTGAELVRMLAFHPSVSIAYVSSQSYEGKALPSIFPALAGIKEINDNLLISPQEAVGRRSVDCVFSCLPHAASAELLVPVIEKGVKVVDLSADFRIRDINVYKKWYCDDKHPNHPAPHLIEKAVFGLPEHYRPQIAAASIIANPGCYVTSVLLPLLPLLKGGVSIDTIIADSKSGVSGAGRGLKQNTHFPEAHENFSAYSIGRKHRHTPEMEQELSLAAGKPVQMTFSPHLLPINRGILSTIYITANRTAAECADIVKKFYASEPFVRVREPSDLPQIANVVHTNYCDIAFTGGTDGLPVIAVSTLDNLVKGASGQALQNMNIMFGLPETAGLMR
ncbi:MAG: N-acetyl-gamma-glutamyl-phosphate reductase [Chitinispirillia bacterium]|nr:N-acetyl-gamma-glutamyl-phosphate reductase [Chitinispirillia bacterium]MCL2241214.1 N-acetyl-gamma-glutamyl-phosphate reductase [Chitinispirillia bacterium]